MTLIDILIYLLASIGTAALGFVAYVFISFEIKDANQRRKTQHLEDFKRMGQDPKLILEDKGLQRRHPKLWKNAREEASVADCLCTRLVN